jgi:hypothetical protein
LRINLESNMHTQQENLLQVTFRLSKNTLYDLFSQVLHDLDGRVLQVDGMKLTLSLGDKDQLSIQGVGQKLSYIVPVRFQFVKPAGLFSIEGTGEIAIHLSTMLHISEDMDVSPKTELVGYHWSVAPSIQLGTMDVPVESLADCMIRHLSASWIHTMDEELSKQLHLQELISQSIAQYAHNKLIHSQPDLFVNVCVFQILANSMMDTTDEILLDLWLELGVKVSDKEIPFGVQQKSRFYWVNTGITSPTQQIELEYSYEGLAELLADYLNGLDIGGKKVELSGVSLGYQQQLEIKLDMIAPIRGMVTLTCQPRLHLQQQKWYADDVQIDLAPTQLIYKLSAPLIENFLATQIRQFFPFDPRPFLERILSSMPEFKIAGNHISLIPEVERIVIRQPKFEQDRVTCTLQLEEASVLVGLEG